VTARDPSGPPPPRGADPTAARPAPAPSPSPAVAFFTLGSRAEYRETFLLAYPVVLSLLSQTAMGLTDTLFMGRVSVEAQGGVGLGAILVWTCASFFSGTLTVVNTFVAQLAGAGEPRRTGAVLWNGVLLALLFSLLTPVVFLLAERLVLLFEPTPEVAPIAASYARIRLAGLPFVFFEFLLSSTLRGLGDTRTPMKISLGVVLANVPLAWWLIFGGLGVRPMGAAGAALATVIASAGGTVVLGALVLGPRARALYATWPPVRPDRRQLGDLARLGLPIGAGWALEMFIWLLFTGTISRIGKVPLAAHQIVLMVIHVSFMPGTALATAATTLVGQRLGARDKPGARRIAYATLRLAMAFMGLMGLVFLFFGGEISRFFNPTQGEVVAIATRLFVLAAAFQLFDALGMVSGGILRGAGDTRFPMMIGVLTSWLVFLPLIWILGIALHLGVFGAWTGAMIYIIVLGAILFAKVRLGHWEDRDLVVNLHS
jgi:multidrug resistance protein, MATE family